MLAGLHQAQMARGQLDARIVRDRAEYGNAERLDRLAQNCRMFRAAHPVEDDAGHVAALPVVGEALDQRRRRLRLRLGVDYQHHGQVERLRQVSGRADARPGAIEQAHHTLDHDQLGLRPGQRSQRPDTLGRHGPAVEIEARATARRLMKPGIDVIWAHLGRRDPVACPRQGAQQPQRHQRLARAGRRRCDHQAAGLSQDCSP